MSLTGFIDVLCDMEAYGRMGREGGKWGLRRGCGLWGAVTGLWDGPARGEETYWEAAPSAVWMEDTVMDAIN